MIIYYVLKSTSIYHHGIFAVVDSASTAINAAKDFAANDRDDHHEWSVHKVDTKTFNIKDADDDYYTVGKEIGSIRKGQSWVNTK